jgi:hypothetical protein
MDMLYNQTKTINDLIYNENMHIVSVFKDYLIMDDINEFLKRPYANVEQKMKLNRLCHFYNQFSEVFPNYIGLIPTPASHLFKNIQRKQRMIDEKEQILNKKEKKKVDSSLKKLFTADFIKDVNATPKLLTNAKVSFLEKNKKIKEESLNESKLSGNAERQQPNALSMYSE